MKYKLIKEYPGSIKLGTEISNTSGYLSTWLVASDYPEFWEKVEEKTYKITSFWLPDLSNNSHPHVQQTICFKEGFEGNSEWLIYSVERLSDGKVFTIGDKVKLERDPVIYEIGELRVNTYIPSDIYVCEKQGRFGQPLSALIPYKAPLFTTEDGVELFEGDSYTIIIKDRLELPSHSTYILKKELHSSYDDKKFLYFSTKEKAEEYILVNKPCLSIKDCLSIKNLWISNLSSLDETLINFVKSKNDSK